MFGRERLGVGDWAVMALGVLFALIGVVLTIGGGWLIVVGGSWYYLLAGLGLIATGALLFVRRMEAFWLYLLIFVLTVVWALFEVGLNGWALVPRVFAPFVLLLLTIAAIPVLAPARNRWVTPWSDRFSGKPLMLAGFAGAAVFAIVAGVAVAAANRFEVERDLPAGGFSAPERISEFQTGADWPAYGGTRGAQRYTTLTQITRDNVGELERVWAFNTGDIPEKFGAETTPLKVGDTLYLCSAMNVLIALDASSGLEKWRYDPEISDDAIPYTAACRGVVYHAAAEGAAADASINTPVEAAALSQQDRLAPCTTRIVEGTLDGRLIAVDARTGVPCADFGQNGAVDIKAGMGDVIPGMVSITSPPVIVNGVIITGHQVLDGQYNEAPSGVIQGFDVVTGELRWAWDMMRPDITGMPPEGETYTRGTPNMWTMATGDEELGLVYLPMGNSAADYYSSDRAPAENEYATSLVALDAATGRPVWHFQTVRIDVWDYDLGSQATLIDFPVNGTTVPALILPSKQGDLYILDRRTGRPLTPVEDRPAPQGGVEPEQRAETQPFSLFHTLARPDRLTERDMWGMSPIDQMICRIDFRRAAYDGIYTPPTSDRRWIQYPGYNGGSDWGGVAFDPDRGVIIANYNDMPNYNRLVPREEANERGWYPRGDVRADTTGAEGAGDPQVGVPYAIDVNAGWRMPFTGLLCKEPPYGGIRAIDIRNGQTIWDRPLGTARKNGPFGIPSMLPLNIGTPNNGGSVVTASGLIFIAAATDDLIRAIDMETGETVWQDVLPAGGQATPMIYEQEGRQFLVIMAGGHHFMETPPGDALIAYALPQGNG
ncbi:MAG: membrane-bound PQQ-dependent dehydrogenase, glucose/quinate/shikimate family [Brevundimonas sp.]